MIHGLALCAGAGGLELGVKLALGDAYVTVGYVERDSYAAACLLARMEDEALERAAVWCGDLADLDARPLRGHVDLVTAGFPCQPASTAGARRGVDDERWLWPEVERIIREVGPGLVYVENVPGLLTVNDGRAMGEVLGGLAALGFDAEWGVFSAADVGAASNPQHGEEPETRRRSGRRRTRGTTRGAIRTRRPRRMARRPRRPTRPRAGHRSTPRSSSGS